jgi:hypothetical protein
MPSSNEAKRKHNAEIYLELWNLPNCIGAMDGKHILLKCFPKSRSLYFNYKGYFLVVLLTCAHPDGLFTTVHVRDFGKNSDSSMFRACPQDKCRRWKNCVSFAKLPYQWMRAVKRFPTTYVADEAFQLKVNLMRPYTRRMLTNKRHIFNYRISHAREV